MMNISSATTSESCVCENWNSITNPSMVSFLGFEANHHHQQQFNEWDSNPNTTITITNTNTNTSYNPFSPTPNTFLPSSTFGGNGYSTISYPKLSDYSMAAEIIGLNLGRRTYFSTQESAVMDRLFKRPRGFYETAHAPRCQAEGCVIDLTHAKHYHRRHKVCEFHSKATKVIASGLEQRFCQQCSRFHVLGEFDEGKRSCRKRLADHNRRRRKPPPSKAAEKANTEAVSSSGAKSEMEKSLPSSTTCISKNLLDLEQQQLQQQQEVDMSYATATNHQRQASSMFNDSPTMSLFERELFYSSSNEATQSMGGGGGGNGSASDRINQHHHEDLQNLFHLGQALFDVEFSD